MVKSVYIHIPFCKSKCHYCSFISFCKIENKKDYLQALYEEIKNSYHGELLETLYFGGGTWNRTRYSRSKEARKQTGQCNFCVCKYRYVDANVLVWYLK